jgi:hypothetical protein
LRPHLRYNEKKILEAFVKITTTLLSIPPYLSTTWKNISTLHVREEQGISVLTVILQNKTEIEIPNLDQETLAEILETHSKAIEESSKNELLNPFESPFSFSLPIKSDLPFDTLGSPMQHNPDQAHLPPIPTEVLKKIGTVVKAFGLEDLSALAKPEPHCHCMYCQVIRSLDGSDSEEEVVADADLTFRDWEIVETGDKLYSVTNPLDQNEHYSVYLGTPLGCTCGSKNCEHIRAVLNS